MNKSDEIVYMIKIRFDKKEINESMLNRISWSLMSLETHLN